MKKYNLKKSLAALGLATAISINLVGCSNNNQQGSSNNSSENASQSEIIKNGPYKTEDYYLIYLDGNLYLTTKERVKNGSYNSFYRYSNNYYDAKTGEFIGKVICSHPGTRYQVEEGSRFDSEYFDDLYFEGEYGYSKIIPIYSQFPVAKLISSTSFGQEEFDFLSSNSTDLKNLVMSNFYFNEYQVPDYYIMHRNFFSIPVSIDEYTEEVPLKKYVCETKEGSKNIFIGYRCSYSENDMGYNYIYDILTGTIQYIGNVKENSFFSIKIYEYDNSKNKTIAELIEEFNTAKEQILNDDSNIKILAKDLFVLDSQDSSVIYATENVQRYYFLVNTGTKDEGIDSWYIYNDLFNEANALVSEDTLASNYCDFTSSTIIMHIGDEKNNALKPINEYLTLNGLSDLIKSDGQYSIEELTEVYEYISSLDIQKTLSKSEN